MDAAGEVVFLVGSPLTTGPTPHRGDGRSHGPVLLRSRAVAGARIFLLGFDLIRRRASFFWLLTPDSRFLVSDFCFLAPDSLLPKARATLLKGPRLRRQASRLFSAQASRKSARTWFQFCGRTRIMAWTG